MSDIEIKIVDGPVCPQCGGVEVLLGGPVRPYKVDLGRGWESHCTSCDIWFTDEDAAAYENGDN